MLQPFDVPEITSDRLLLRRHVEADLDDAYNMWSDTEVVRHIGGKPFTRAEVWQRLLRYIGHWSVRPYGYWAIVERTSGCFLGEVGLANWLRDGYGSFLNPPECGWVLAPHAQRQGYALEALQAVLGWADAELGSETVCIIDPGNAASIRLAEKVGYRRVTADFEKSNASLLFERPARLSAAAKAHRNA